MSYILAVVSKIERCESLHILEFMVRGHSLSMVSLEISKAIMIGTKVKLMVKPTHITIAKDFTGKLSDANQLPCKITSIEEGKLLSSIKLDFFDVTFESIITLASLESMQLKVGENVSVFIKASDLSIQELLDA